MAHLAQGMRGALGATSIFVSLARTSIGVLGALIAFQTVGVSITPALTALGVGGIAIALALQRTLSNLFSGLQIIASQQVAPVDDIRLATGEEGYVTDINWRNTSIRAPQNNRVIVPNSTLASTVVTNFHQPTPELAVLVDLGVSYDSDLARVEAVTVEVAGERTLAWPWWSSGGSPATPSHVRAGGRHPGQRSRSSLP